MTATVARPSPKTDITGRRNHDRDVGAHGGGREGRDWRVVDAAGDLRDRVGGGGGDEEQARAAALAAEVDVGHGAVYLDDRDLAGREVYRVGVDDAGALPAHHGDDVGSMADELADELHVLDGGDAAGDAEDYLLSLQFLALGAIDALTGVHAGEV